MTAYFYVVLVLWLAGRTQPVADKLFLCFCNVGGLKKRCPLKFCILSCLVKKLFLFYFPHLDCSPVWLSWVRSKQNRRAPWRWFSSPGKPTLGRFAAFRRSQISVSVWYVASSIFGICRTRVGGGGGSSGAYCLAVMRVKRSTDGACTAAESRWFHSLVVRTKKVFFSWSVLHLDTWNVRELFRRWSWIPLVTTQVIVIALIRRPGLCLARNSEGGTTGKNPSATFKRKKSQVYLASSLLERR